MATSKLRASKPKDFIAALKEAEKVYATAEKPPKSGEVVKLALKDIHTDTALFQPREFSYGWKDVDKSHVTQLAKAISINGQLDPISVVKLWQGRWYCVDGHHRLAAYKAQAWSGTLDCVWLGGGRLRDVISEALKGNNKRLLTLDNSTRQNAAWRYTLLGGLTQKQVSENCGISFRQVGNMRRVLKAYREPGPARDRMRVAFPGGMEDASWLAALLAFNDGEEKKVDLEERAQRLARNLQSRMTDKLRKDLDVAARALMIHAPDLVRHIKDRPLSLLADEDD